MTNDPAACKNCHIMNDVSANWSKGGHQHVTNCNDCHVPHNFMGKWYTKANNGFHHSWAFTFKDVPVAIRARPASKKIVQNNCERCHHITSGHAITSNAEKKESLSCVSCHREAGHMH